MKRWLLVMCILVGTILGLVPVTAQTPPQFEEGRCPMNTPPEVEVDCGYLTVPENRADPDSPLIRLPVAIFRAENPQADPIFYLEGGPGGSALKQMENTFSLLFAPLVTDRDLVVMDQRGTGFAEPSLACPEVDQFTLATLDQRLTQKEEIDLEFAAMAACYKRLVQEGINLDAYNSAENAADFEDLRLALGYDQVNLYGISYGTRLALTILRDYPDGVRSVVLDSSYPLQENLYASIAPNFDRALQTLIASCAAESTCQKNYPDVENTLFNVVEKLNAKPAILETQSPTTFEPYTIVLTGDRLMAVVFQAFYQAGWIPYLPQMIYAAEAGNFELVSLLYMALVENFDQVSYGMNLAVQCHDEVPFSPLTEFPTENLTRLQEYLNAQINLGANIYPACAVWNADPQPAAEENEPVLSDTPTLILAGEFDPITPPVWGKLLSQDLSQSYFFTYPTSAHGASVDTACAASMIQAFWADPTQSPNEGCLAEIPPVVFYALGQIPPVTLTPFTDADFGVRGVRPEGWDSLGFGTAIRPGLYDTALAQLSMPNMGREQVAGMLLGQLGGGEMPAPIDTLQANGLEWDIYQMTVGGLALQLGVAEADEILLVILLQSRPSELPALYEAVFLPALEALVAD